MKPLASGAAIRPRAALGHDTARFLVVAAFACVALAAPAVVRAAPCIPVITAAITPNASIALPGQTVNFTISYTNTCMALASTLDFGDGNMMVLGPPYPKSVSHVY